MSRSPFGPAPRSDGLDDLGIGPATDAGLGVGRDVGGVDSPERAVVAATTAVDRPVLLRVASASPCRAEDVLAVGHLLRSGRVEPTMPA